MSVSVVKQILSQIPLVRMKHDPVLNMYAIMYDRKKVAAMAHMLVEALCPLPGTLFLCVTERATMLAAEMARLASGHLVPVLRSDAPLYTPSLYTINKDESVVILPCTMPSDSVPRAAIIVDDYVEYGDTSVAVTQLLAEHYPHVKVQTTACVVRVADKCFDHVPVTSLFDYDSSGYPSSVGMGFCSPLVIKPAARSLVFDSGAVTLYPPSMGWYALCCDRRRHILTQERAANGVPVLEFPSFVSDKEINFVIDMQDCTSMQDSIEFARVLAVHVDRLQVIVPYFPELDGDNAGSGEAVARQLGQMPLTKTGNKVVLRILDLRAARVRSCFGDAVTVKMVSRLRELKDTNCVFVFPDEGAYERHRSCISGKQALVLTKTRVGDECEMRLRDRIGIFPDGMQMAGTKFVIFDDAARTFGTVLDTIRWLQREGAEERSVSVAIPNIDSTGDSLLHFFHDAPACFDKLMSWAQTRDAVAMAHTGFFGDRFFSFSGPLRVVPHRSSSVVLVASENQAKANAADAYYTVNVPSGVPEQPIGPQVMAGATFRARSAAFLFPESSVIVRAFESGAIDQMEAVACVEIVSDKNSPETRAGLHVTTIRHPDEFYDPANQDVTTGQRMRKAYNLESDDAWLGAERPDMLRMALSCVKPVKKDKKRVQK